MGKNIIYQLTLQTYFSSFTTTSISRDIIVFILACSGGKLPATHILSINTNSQIHNCFPA